MRFLLSAALKDLRWRRRDPAALLIWIGIPLLLGLLFGLLGGGGTPRPHVLLLDEDQSFVSRMLVRASGAEQARQTLEVEEVATLEAGRARMDAGEASGLLVVPKGFGDAVLRERPAELRLVTNPAQRILPRIVEEGLEILLEGAFYGQRLFGEPLRRIADGPPGGTTFSNADVAALSVEINERVRRLRGVLLPPVLQLEVEQDAGARPPSPGFALLFFPGVLLMSLVFVAQGMSDDVWAEKEQGVLARFVATPQPVSRFLAARVLAGAALMALVAGAGLAIGVVVFDLALVRIPLALAWCTVAGTALLAMFMLLQLLASSRRTAGLLGSLVMFPLLMIGGSFFPFETMPAWMGAVGRLTPNGQAVAQLKLMLYGQPDAGALATAAAAIALAGGVAFLLAVRRLRGGFVRV
jgi:ABC-type Na+ efflux pump permease subunit